MDGARKLFEESLTVNRETGDKRAATLSLINVGNVLNNSGHPEPAKQRYREASVAIAVQLVAAEELAPPTAIRVIERHLAHGTTYTPDELSRRAVLAYLVFAIISVRVHARLVRA